MEYASENLKIGEIGVLSVLATQTALLQANKSTADYQVLKSDIQLSLAELQRLKNQGHVYEISTVMLDGTPQKLTNLQFIDALNSNIE